MDSNSLTQSPFAAQRAEARLREKLSDEQVASVNPSLTRSLVQLRVKHRQAR
jgi:hypothetical protein